MSSNRTAGFVRTEFSAEQFPNGAPKVGSIVTTTWKTPAQATIIEAKDASANYYAEINGIRRYLHKTEVASDTGLTGEVTPREKKARAPRTPKEPKAPKAPKVKAEGTKRGRKPKVKPEAAPAEQTVEATAEQTVEAAAEQTVEATAEQTVEATAEQAEPVAETAPETTLEVGAVYVPLNEAAERLGVKPDTLRKRAPSMQASGASRKNGEGRWEIRV